jgi:glycosyltransferase involved in cell wall biosynthesis
MNLRIAIMGTRGIPNFYGGFEQLAEHLAPGLARAGHEVTVYNSHNHPFRGDNWEGVRIVHCYDPEYILGSAGQFIYDFNCLLDARKRDFDVILQLGYTSSSIWGPFFPSGAMVIYNMDGLEWQRDKYSRTAQRFLLFAEKLAVKYSDFYVTDSPVIQSYFKDKYNIKSEYIAYGADLFPVADESVLKDYQVTAGDYYLLMARMEAENNIAMILEGFVRSDTEKKILVVGNTTNKYGKKLEARFSADPRIIFTGGIYEQQRIHALKFYSRMYFHGHSTGGTNPSLLEAMASKALIAAHDNPFNREVLGSDALYFTSPEEITGIINHIPLREQEMLMTCNNREKIIRRFDWPDIIAKYEKFIQQSLLVHRKADPIFVQRYGNKNTLPPMGTGSTPERKGIYRQDQRSRV